MVVEMSQQMRTHYQNLKVAEDAPIEVIRAAYRALSQQYHPDRNPDPEANRIMQIINDSYETLSDSAKRAKHDETIRRFREKQTQKESPAQPTRKEPPADEMQRPNPRPTQTQSSNQVRQSSQQAKPNEALWQVFEDDNVSGPFTIAELAALYRRGTITMKTFVARVGKADWKPLETMLEEPLVARRRQKSLTTRLATAAAWIIGVILLLMILGLTDQSSSKRSPAITSSSPYGSGATVPRKPLPTISNTSVFANTASPTISGQPVSTFARAPTVSHPPPYRRPSWTPYGLPWPTSSGYISGAPTNAYGGLSSLTVDNSACATDVHVKLVFKPTYQSPSVARECIIKARTSFEFGRVTKGVYEVRYRDLESGNLAKSEPFTLEEIETSTGTQYSVMTLTLYKVRDGNTHLLPLDDEDF